MKRFCLLVFCAIASCCCDSDNGINYEDEKNSSVTVTKISISPSEMVVGSENGSCSVSVWLTTDSYSYHNEPEWKLTGGASWCNPYKISGRGNDVIEFKVYENPDSDDRSATFTVTCQNLQSNFTIIQRGQGINTITGTPAKIDVEAVGGDIDIEIKANIDYTYKIDSKCKDWITATDGSANGESKITLNVAPNPDATERQGVITITSSETSEKVTIIQSGITLLVVSSKIEVEGIGGEAIIEIKSDVDYTYDIDSKCKDWIMPADTRAVETTQIALNVAPNPTLKERQGTVTVSSGNISEKVTIIQSAGKPYIELKQTEYDVSKDGETIEVEVNSNCDFNITIPDCNWIKTVQNKTAPANKKYFEISKNPQPESRTAEIIFEGNEYNVSAKVSVTQQPASSLNISVNVPQIGTLASVLSQYKMDEVDVVSLKISGVLNDVDFVHILNIANLKDLDISEVNITSLPNRAFYESKNVENIILPNTLIVIGKEQFYYSNLNTIYIPKNIETIEASAFKKCTQLTTVTFEKGSQLKTIGGGYSSSSSYGAFSDCSSLTSIEIPASVETIEAAAFKGCFKLTTVTFEKGSKLQTIGGGYYGPYGNSSSYYYGAFSDCSSLTSIEIPASVETIEAAAFQYCSKLATVTFEKGSKLKVIGGGYAYSYASSYYYGAFSDCSSLTSIEIPASVETIEAAAFKRCTQLTTVTFEKGSKLKVIGGGYHAAAGYDDSPYYYGAFSDCPITSIEIPASVEAIEAVAFKGCSKLATVTFEKGSKLKIIGGGSSSYNGAFCKLTSLMIVDMSECTQVESIGRDAFCGDKELRLFLIGTETPPTCGHDAFYGINPASVLKVPSGCVDAYKNVFLSWSYYFANITGLDE